MRRRHRSPAFLALLVCFVATWAALAVLSVPVAFGWVPAALVVWILGRAEAGSIWLVVVSLFIGVGLLELIARQLPAEIAVYRPEERLSLPREKHYVPNANEPGFAVPHGDLVAMSGGGAAKTAEPRNIRFKTDALGYRNDRNYGGEKLVLVGDSFVVGVGTSQDDMLSVQLGNRLGRSVYNASYPVEPDGYAAIIRRLRQSVGGDFKAVVLFFEGNDFECGGKNPSSTTWANYVPGDIRRLKSYRLFYGMTGRLQASLLHAGDVGQVAVRDVAGQPVSFYKNYIRQARRSEACDWSYYRNEIKSVAENLAMLVFIPEKIRIYQPLIVGEPALPSSPAFAFVRDLAAEMKLLALDLTPALQAAARDAASQGRFVFWRDDTHWNGAGIAVAAEKIAEALARLPPG